MKTKPNSIVIFLLKEEATNSLEENLRRATDYICSYVGTRFIVHTDYQNVISFSCTIPAEDIKHISEAIDSISSLEPLIINFDDNTKINTVYYKEYKEELPIEETKVENLSTILPTTESTETETDKEYCVIELRVRENDGGISTNMCQNFKQITSKYASKDPDFSLIGYGDTTDLLILPTNNLIEQILNDIESAKKCTYTRALAILEEETACNYAKELKQAYWNTNVYKIPNDRNIYIYAKSWTGASKILACKALKNLTGKTLKEVKEIVDFLIENPYTTKLIYKEDSKNFNVPAVNTLIKTGFNISINYQL